MEHIIGFSIDFPIFFHDFLFSNKKTLISQPWEDDVPAAQPSSAPSSLGFRSWTLKTWEFFWVFRWRTGLIISPADSLMSGWFICEWIEIVSQTCHIHSYTIYNDIYYEHLFGSLQSLTERGMLRDEFQVMMLWSSRKTLMSWIEIPTWACIAVSEWIITII